MAKDLSYKDAALQVRLKVLEMIHRSRGPHIGSSFSCVEILCALYGKLAKVSPKTKNSPGRDRIIFSKGHACPALYAALHLYGFISNEKLDSFATNAGAFEQHPRYDLSSGIEATTGSLGHGLSIAAGMALALKKEGSSSRVWVVLSDGELDEGSTWEAALFAAHHRLDNLYAIVDYNHMQAMGPTKATLNLDPLIDKWRSFGWAAKEGDGHDFQDIFKAFKKMPFNRGKPGVFIANTIKGKGVSFMESKLLWHYRAPDDIEYKKALEELKP